MLVAYYNGVRMRGQESLEGEEETGYAIFVEVNLRKDKNAEHMDIPPQVQMVKGLSFLLLVGTCVQYQNCLSYYPYMLAVPELPFLIQTCTAGEQH